MTVTNIEDKRLALDNDIDLWISTADSANARRGSWKNRKIKWSRLLQKIKEPVRTDETLDEYLRMTKAKQGAIKDKGGFVGGRLKDGVRNGQSVEGRQIIALDLDFAKKDFVAECFAERPYAWALYSTHKSTPDKPRYRFLVPLSREVGPEEYEACARMLAKEIGLEQMDPTTFQPERLMFWPTVAEDAKYEFEYWDGDIVDPDTLLSEYPDGCWQDRSYWPVCKGEDSTGIPKEVGRKQQNPLEKNGLIGAFCRTYTIDEAIAEFLDEVYKPSENMPGRYTYINGSTSNGVVPYGEHGEWVYSNHSTDPACGKLCNAWDLVRIHLFGDQDEDADYKKESSRPSFKAMEELAQNDKRVKKLIVAEKVKGALEDFEEDLNGAEDWSELLEVDKKGNVEPSLHNLLVIIKKDPEYAGIRFNERSSRTVKADGEDWTDSNDAELRIELNERYASFKKQDLLDVIEAVSRERRFDPVRDYLDSVEWDGVERCEELLIRYLGVEDSRYTRELTKLWLKGAVARVYDPGCKFDYTIVLSGEGGIGKSMLASKLGGAWYSDALTFADMHDKTAAEKLKGNWVIEISELAGMKRTDEESVKRFLTATFDEYRAAYGRRTERSKRSCVFIGTTNEEGYLRDTTGNRRFWPMMCKNKGINKVAELTSEDVAQIWAEAKVLYEIDDRLVPDRDLEDAIYDMQIKALAVDEWRGIIEEYLERLLPEEWYSMDVYDRRTWLNESKNDGVLERERVCVSEIWAECLGGTQKQCTRTDSNNIKRVLLSLGWEQKDRIRFPIYGQQRCFYRRKKGL